MFDMNVFYNPNGYLTKKNNFENDKAFKNRILKIRNRENKFFNEKNLPFFLPKYKSFKNFTKRNLSFDQEQQRIIHIKTIKNLRLKKPSPYCLDNYNQGLSNLLLKNKNKVRLINENIIKKNNEFLGERIGKIRHSSSSNLFLPKLLK
jgi:hypothetical protein